MTPEQAANTIREALDAVWELTIRVPALAALKMLEDAANEATNQAVLVREWERAADQHRLRAEAAVARADALTHVATRLVALVRIGFLVTVGGERATYGTVGDSAMSGLLYTILHAEDSEAAAREVLAAATPDTQENDG